jgi:hypothetical protein
VMHHTSRGCELATTSLPADRTVTSSPMKPGEIIKRLLLRGAPSPTRSWLPVDATVRREAAVGYPYQLVRRSAESTLLNQVFLWNAPTRVGILAGPIHLGG